MTSNAQEKIPEKKLFAELRGRYTLIDGQKLFHFDFPNTSSLEDNFSTISFIKEKVLEAIKNKEKEEKEKNEIPKNTNHEQTP